MYLKKMSSLMNLYKNQMEVSTSFADLNGDPNDFTFCYETMIPYYVDHFKKAGDCHIFDKFTGY